MKIKNWLVGYFKELRLYFGIKYRVMRWKGSDNDFIHRELVRLLQKASSVTYDLVKDRYGKLIPKNPMK